MNIKLVGVSSISISYVTTLDIVGDEPMRTCEFGFGLIEKGVSQKYVDIFYAHIKLLVRFPFIYPRVFSIFGKQFSVLPPTRAMKDFAKKKLEESLSGVPDEN